MTEFTINKIGDEFFNHYRNDFEKEFGIAKHLAWDDELCKYVVVKRHPVKAQQKRRERNAKELSAFVYGWAFSQYYYQNKGV